jgi:hypothetical protein
MVTAMGELIRVAPSLLDIALCPRAPQRSDKTRIFLHFYAGRDGGHAMQSVGALIALLILAPVLAAVVWCWGAYRRDLQASRLVLKGASGIAETLCGPIEYAEAGDGAPVLVIHGAGGGFDRGLELSRPLASRGCKVIAISRFGCLRTPLARQLKLTLTPSRSTRLVFRVSQFSALRREARR